MQTDPKLSETLIQGSSYESRAIPESLRTDVSPDPLLSDSIEIWPMPPIPKPIWDLLWTAQSEAERISGSCDVGTETRRTLTENARPLTNEGPPSTFPSE